ncbi:hypothetical protein B0O99DRAFT_642543 [Bisporella sp. PMI_857]|nr:hypothetical protein B0O99DRAFT_642543 [Bisporella sp. PMI_857]
MTLASELITPAFLTCIKNYPELPGDSWYFITAAALCALNRPETVADLLQHVLSGDTKEDLRVIRRLREALIKVAPVTGLPKVITSLLALKTRTPPELLDHDPTIRTKDFVETPASAVLERAKGLNESGTPDLGAAARLMYAFFGSNTSALSGKETMFVTTTGAIVTDVQRIVLNHMGGALNHGATIKEVNAVRGLVIFVCEQAGMTTNGGGWRGDVAKL